MTKDYDVGYKRPPKNYQFKKGESGNKKGRPTKAPTISDALVAALDRPMKLTIGGVVQKVWPRDVLAQKAIHEGLKGRVGLLKFLIDLDKQSVREAEKLASMEIEVELIRAFEVLERRRDLEHLRRAQRELRTKNKKPRPV